MSGPDVQRRLPVRCGALSRHRSDPPHQPLPQRQSDRDARIAWLPHIGDLPWPTAEEVAAGEAKYEPRTSRQHPDHDTESWPPAGAQ